MKDKRWLAILFSVIIIFGPGCGLFSSVVSDDEILFAATEVGAPEGTKVVKDIGPAGGTLASPDGRLTLTVPPNALTETVAFSIQPITNKAAGGLGSAYRLEPAGKTFTTPLEMSVRYDERDLAGTVPEALSLAYQDQQGAWHETKPLQQTENTLTVATTHFSDWAFLANMRIEPAKAKLGVGKTLYVVLIGCAQPEPTFADRFRKKVFGDKWNWYEDPERHCKFGTMDRVPLDWFVDIGTIGDKANPVLYTAPPKKPMPNVATVTFPYSAMNQRGWNRADDIRKGVFTAKITIVDRGYRAEGQTSDVEYSGTVCNLEEPFTIIGSSYMNKFPFKFVPSSPTGGKVDFDAKVSVIVMEGSGFYVVEGADTDKPRIAMTMNSAGHTPLGSHSGGGTVYIDLIPLDTDECL